MKVEFCRNPSEAQELLSEFLALEASGWKERNGTAIRTCPSTVAFYRTLIQNLSAQGLWEWQTIRVGTRLAAAGFEMRCGTSSLLAMTTFDEDFADCRPGNLLAHEILEEAFANQEVHEICLMSRFPSDQIWRMSYDEDVDVHLVRGGIVPALFQLPSVAVHAVYQDYIRPQVPQSVKLAYRKFRRRGERKPKRAPQSARSNTR